MPEFTSTLILIISKLHYDYWKIVSIMSNSETKLLEPINYTIMHTIYQQFSVLTENSALAPSLLALGFTVINKKNLNVGY